MKKTLLTILSLTALVLCFTACSAQEKEGFKTVSDDTCGFSFQCPESWEITHTKGFLSAAAPKDVSNANVTVSSFVHGIKNEGDGAKYYSENKLKDDVEKDYWSEHYKPMLEMFGIEKEQFKEITLGNNKETQQKGVHVKYTAKKGKDVFQCETVLVLYDNNAYVMTLTQGAKNEQNAQHYVDYSDKFLEMVKTLQIKS